MKKFLLSIFALCIVLMSANAAKIYVNPGHGSWNTANCRNMRTINYQQYGDTLGFWESNTNMWKCYALQEKLLAAGHTVKMSRTKTGGTSLQYNSQYDKSLSVIAMESENWGSDYFISVHSNAAGTDEYGNALVNYPSYFYRGTMNRPTHNPYVKNSDKMAIAAWPHTFIIHDNKMEFNSYWSMTNPGIYGDITQMGGQSTVNGYTGYFGVLKHGDPGYLVEGYFHVYSPARHRAMNPDWCRQEGVRHYRGIQAWYGNPKPETKGYIMGYIRTKDKKLTHNFYKPKPGTNDEYHPINGAKVVLRNSKDEVIKTNCYHHVARMLKNQDYYTTDHQYNGVFVYENLEPGEYTMYFHASGYKDVVQKITVKADQTSYCEIFMTAGQGTEPNVGDINPDVEWELNGGIIPGGTVPTNAELWEELKTYYQTYYNENRADQEITAVTTFMTKACDIMTNEKSSFKWMGDYIMKVSAEQGITLTNNPSDEAMEPLWRFAVQAFLNCSTARTNYPKHADFSTAGKPEAWGDDYRIAKKLSASLPSRITSTYTIPTPIKEGYDFLGWYNTNNTTGTKYTTLTAGFQGKLYAIWQETPKGDVTWVLNGGSVSVTLPNYIENNPYTLPTPTRTGYVFLGWYDNAKGEGEKLTQLPVGYKGYVYAIWREAKVTWVLNGGKVLKEVTGADAVKVPTQEELWTSFKTAADITALGTLAEITAAGEGKPHNTGDDPCACRVICAKLTNDKMTAVYAKAEWKWLFDYILGVQPDIETDLTLDGATAAWRYAVAAFFLQSKHEAYPVTEDFTTAGKPELWGPAYKEAQGNSGATSTQEVTLPSKITATYTIPTPVKDGADFLGWYDTNDMTGNKLTTLPAGYDGTIYAIWSDAKEPDVEWVLNGGKVVKEVTTTTPGTEVKVPTQEELWTNFKTAAGLTTLGTLEEIKAKGEGNPHTSGDTPCGCRVICGKLTAAEVQTVFGKAEWKWLQTYIMSVQSDLTDDLTTAAWRYAIAAFFLQSEHTSWPASANFAEAGKPEKWGPAYQKANGATEGTTTTTLVEVELPKWITGSPYTIPTPVKDGDTFVGWYENNQGTGNALTVLPVGYKGTVYAIWQSNVGTGVENVRPALDLDAPMYDVLGRQVDATYRGIIIQNGNKYLLR